jgi:integrase
MAAHARISAAYDGQRKRIQHCGVRRGFACHLYRLGWRSRQTLVVSDLTIQRILRHGDVETTRKAYIKTVPQQSVEAMALFQTTVSKSALVQ